MSCWLVIMRTYLYYFRLSLSLPVVDSSRYLFLLQDKLMHFPTWIDLKGQDSVPDTVHHVVTYQLFPLERCLNFIIIIIIISIFVKRHKVITSETPFK